MAKRDYSSLTKAEKLQLLDAIKEKKARLKKQKPLYTPNSGQMEIHQDTHPIRVVFSANGTGKTLAAVQELHWAATGYNPILDTYTKVPATIAVVVDNQRKIGQIWLPYLHKWFNYEGIQESRDGKPYVSRLTYPNGSEVLFLTQDLDDLVYEGIQIDMLISDEPIERRIFVALTRGMRGAGTKFRVLLLGTPIAQPWIYRDLWKAAERGERDDIGIHRVGIEVNRANLAKDYIETFSKNLTEQEKRARLEGIPVQLEGLALAHLINEDIHYIDLEEWDRRNPVVIAIDPHPSKAHIACMVGVSRDGQLYYLKEIASKAAARPFAQELRAWYEGYRVLDIICDSLGSAASTGGEGRLSFIEVLNQAGVRARATSYKEKSDEAFIELIKEVLVLPETANNFGQRLPKLLINRRCSGIKRDLENVTWLRQKGLDENKPKLDISDKDYLATLKYALATDIGKFKRGKPKVLGPRRKSPWSHPGKR